MPVINKGVKLDFWLWFLSSVKVTGDERHMYTNKISVCIRSMLEEEDSICWFIVGPVSSSAIRKKRACGHGVIWAQRTLERPLNKGACRDPALQGPEEERE